MDGLLARVLKASLGEGRWLVAVSGGGDSVALLRLLVEAGFGGRLVVGNFNHQWGPFGGESEAFVRRLGGDLGLQVLVGHGRVGKAEANGEAVARGERYEWFGEVVAELQLDGVVVAHTLDDVVEGFLMRAGKGSALGGLAGMRKVSQWKGMTVVRPLLEVGREELRDYLRGTGQVWMEDPDNEVGGSQRARVRKLLPELEAVGITRHGIAASVKALAEADEVMDGLVEAIGVERFGGKVVIAREVLVGAPVEVAVRVLARMMRMLGDEGMLVRRGKRVALWERVCGEEKGIATLGGVKFIWDDIAVRGEVEGG